MKSIIILLSAFTFSLTLWAQAPQQLSYQAVLRGVDNKLLSEQKVSVRISILKGSINGKNVYRESHLAETNINGLVTLQIGTGTGSQEFSSIDWSNGPYFIKSEASPGDGNTFSIVGVTQILSVPYALHANSADTVIGELNENDPIFQESVAGSINAIDTARWNKTYLKVNNTEGTFKIGDLALGGVVFWVDKLGEHGLICGMHNLSSTLNGKGAIWMDGYWMDEYTYDDISTASGKGIGAGEMNSIFILLSPKDKYTPNTVNAAMLCANYRYPDLYDFGQVGEQGGEDGMVYADYYLPSIFELRLLDLNRILVSAVCVANDGDPIENEEYWSSNQYDYNNEAIENIPFAWTYNFWGYDIEGQGSGSAMNKNSINMVRPIRKF